MTIRCTAVRADDALASLAAAVGDAKAGSPLSPVTVIVPTNAVGVTARRWLGAHGGVAAIELVTPSRLAERLAGATLAAEGRRPVSTPLIDITVRSVLDDSPGAFAEVARHPSTVTALRDLHREIRMAGPAALAALAAGSPRAREVARVSRATSERLATDWYDEGDLVALAITRVRDGAELFDRAVALFPRPDAGLTIELIRAVGERAELDVLLEYCGVPPVDDEQARLAHRYGAEVAGAPIVSFDAHRAEAVSTTDADEEVRAAVRRIVKAARDGTPFARMCVVWPVDRPYARLVEHHLDAAAIPWNGRPGTLVTERLVPRFLLDLLQLDRRGVRRVDLFDLLADVPVRGPDGGRVSVARWERMARAAGVTRDEHWEPRLAQLAADLRARPEPREAEAEAAEHLAAFVAGLQRDLGPSGRRRTWQQWAEWCERQVAVRLGTSLLDQLDEAERLASDHTTKVLDRLRHLDAVSGPVTRNEFRAAFAAEFEVAPGRLGRLGDGVTIGSLAGTAGLDADMTIVLGAAEGLLPPGPVVDPLISDADRRGAGLPQSDARTRRLHRSFLGHLATSRVVVLSTPRGDLRSSAERLPSRWIAEHAPEPLEHTVASHRAGLLADRFPADATQHRLRGRAAAAIESVEALARSCAYDTVAVRGLATRSARRSDRLTAYDGDLTGIAIPHFPRPVSPSQIETWPACPHAYFVRYLLGVRPLDDSDEALALSPLERGNVVHETLDRFHRLVIDQTLPQPGPDGWSLAHTAVLLELFDEVADEFERTGRTGRAAHWFIDRRSVRSELLNWFVDDGRRAAARGARVLRSEYRFGYEPDDVVALPLADGRSLAVAGYADRIDELADGRLVVTDHKTGKSDPYRAVTADDPTESATRFQLPVYAAAALAAKGETPETATTHVVAEYGFFARGNYERYGYVVDTDVWKQVAVDLQTVVDGIESGLFPAITEPPQFEFYIGCHYCQPDGLGVAERFAEWSAKRRDPRILRWFPADDAAPESPEDER